MEQQWSVQLVLVLLKRNWWIIILLALIFTPIFYVITPYLPKKYTSDTLIVVRYNVEEGVQNRQKALQNETVNRINVIKNQVLSRTSLTKIVKDFDLYRDWRERYPLEYTLDKVKKSIRVNVFSGATGFQVSYKGEDPEKVRKVTDELASLFVDLHYKMQQQLYVRTQFLRQQLQIKKKELERLDKKIKEFRNEHNGELPEQLENNVVAKSTFLRLLETNSRFLSEAENTENIGANEYKNLLALALEDLNKNYNLKKVVSLEEEKEEEKDKEATKGEKQFEYNPEKAKSEEERLLEERLQLEERLKGLKETKTRALFEFTELHPTIARLDQEIDLVTEQIAKLPGGEVTEGGQSREVYVYNDEVRKRIKKLIDSLAGLSNDYEKYLLLQNKISSIDLGEVTPELEKDLDELTEKVRSLEEKAFENVGVVLRTLPDLEKKAKDQYKLHLRTNSLRAERRHNRKELAKYQERINNTPKIQQLLSKMEREFDEISKVYEVLSARVNEASIKEDIGDKFQDVELILLDQAYLPVAKFEILYKVFFLAGTIFGGILGIAIAILRHFVFPRLDDMPTMQLIADGTLLIPVPRFKVAPADMKSVPVHPIYQPPALPGRDPALLSAGSLPPRKEIKELPLAESVDDPLLLESKGRRQDPFSQDRFKKTQGGDLKNITKAQEMPFGAFAMPQAATRWDAGMPFDSMIPSPQVEIVPTENLTAFFSNNSPVTNIYRKLRFQIFPKHQTEENRKRRVMFTSALAQEGKTTTSFNVAGAIATGIKEKAIWIDCNLDSPMDYGGKRYEIGLANILAGEIKLKEAILKTQLDRLMILPAGETYLNSAELLSSDAMVNLVDEISDTYPDHLILFDTMPILSSNEPSLLASLIDQIVFVVRAHRTSPKVLEKALNQLDKSKVSTYVFNGVDPVCMD